MGKSAKFLSVFLLAMIVLSTGGFFASYRHGKNNPTKTTTSSASSTREQADTTKKAAESIKTTSKEESEQTILVTTTKTATKPDSTKTSTTLKTGYPFSYAGINPVLTNISPENWNLILINADYYIPESYNFKLATAVEGYPAKLDARAAVYYAQMFKAAKKEDITLSPTSVNGGYRSINTQKGLFDRRIDKLISQGSSRSDAIQKAAKINQPPGCSEHNAGLAMDIISTQTTFENTKAFKWLSQNAADYGFILRYDRGKESITGVMYEPWHWRYVGADHAKAIKASGLCFEEYYKTL